MKNSGFFAITLTAMLIFFALGILALHVSHKQKIYNLEKELIEIKDLSYDRSEFEYNLKNAIKTHLDHEVQITQEQTVLKASTDTLVRCILNDYNFVSILISGLLIVVFECPPLNCVYYRYSTLLPISKEITRNNKTIEIKIPINYTIENICVIP